MDSNDKCNKKDCQTDIGRGCNFCTCGDEVGATACKGCFKLHAYDWLEQIPNNMPEDIFEVRFKNTRKSYFQNVNNISLKQGDIVAVEASPGHDIGIVSLTGDIVAKQMRRIGFTPMNGEFKKIYRKAKPYDLEKWQEAIAQEHETMIMSRRIASEMNLNMKIGDVEYQGDRIKAIFYYIADERVDFRELIKVFAEQFRVRIEMKQIGARQEAGRIGGLGSCGRELCCASWISGFVSVTTNSARHQEISLNPQKLAGQCSKLKCCLVYELDVYMDARKDMPRVHQPLQAIDGEYYLVKMDILGRTMSFSSSPDSMANFITLPIERVREVIEINKRGKKVDQLQVIDTKAVAPVEEPRFVNAIGEESITRFDRKSEKQNKPGVGGNHPNNRNQKRDHRSNHEPKKPEQGQTVTDNNTINKGNTQPSSGKTGENNPGRSHSGNRHNRRPGGNPNNPQGRKGGENNSGVKNNERDNRRSGSGNRPDSENKKPNQ